MKSKIIIVFIIAFVFVFTVAVFLCNALKQDKNLIDYKQQNMDLATRDHLAITPITTTESSPTPSPAYDSEAIFFDDFDESDLNLCYWNILERELNYNSELQSYAKGNVFIENNCLVLLAENIDDKYTSGLVNTKSKIEFQYGIVSVRLKYPAGKSFFPAIWMLPADGTSFPEIDIMEVVGHNPDTLYFVYHYYNGEKQKFYSTTEIKEYENFHTYSLIWTPEDLTWYVDSVQVYQIKTDIPHEPMYLIINMAVGGIWPGDPDENTVFPAKVLVDYVKITPYTLIDEENIDDIY